MGSTVESTNDSTTDSGSVDHDIRTAFDVLIQYLADTVTALPNKEVLTKNLLGKSCKSQIRTKRLM